MLKKFIGFIIDADQPDHVLIEQLLEAISAQSARTVPTQRPSATPAIVARGCDLGQGVILEQNERIYCYLRRRLAHTKRPDGVAVARDGALFVGEGRVQPQRRAWLQAALKIVQRDAEDISKKTGGAKSLNAWEHWFKITDGKPIPLGDLRPKVPRRQELTRISARTAEELGL
jgi:hypothetical protein